MVVYKTGNILAENAEALVNTVNCVGIMGRGVALQFKKEFPENFEAYAVACKRKEVKPGQMFIHGVDSFVHPRFIINFPTKRHWKGKSRLEDIKQGLAALVGEIKNLGIRSIALPPLGCGLGGLNWEEVKTLIESALGGLPGVEVIVFEPMDELAADKSVRNKEVPDMTPGRAVLVALIDRYLAGLLDPTVTLLEVHKLMYFMQEAGEPLKLRFKQAAYGPYADNLRHVLHAVEGHLISGYSDGGDAPGKVLDLVPGALEDAQAVLEEHGATKKRTERVAKLVEGFESPFGLELLATVHWVIKREQPKSAEDVVRLTYAWNKRKRQFSQRQIHLAMDVLAQQSWVDHPQPC